MNLRGFSIPRLRSTRPQKFYRRRFFLSKSQGEIAKREKENAGRENIQLC